MVQEFPLLGTIQVILPLVICLLMLFCTNCSFLLGPPLFSSSVLQSLLWLCYDHNLTLLYGFFLPVLLFFFLDPILLLLSILLYQILERGNGI